MSDDQWGGFIFFVAGLGFSALFLWYVWNRWVVLNRRGVPTVGRVVSVQTNNYGEGGTHTTSTVEFVDPTGETHVQWCQTHDLESLSGLYCSEVDVRNNTCVIVERTLPGEKHRFGARGRHAGEVDVVYDPQKPRRAQVNSRRSSTRPRWSVLVGKVLFVATALLWTVGPLVAGTLLLLEVWVIDP